MKKVLFSLLAASLVVASACKKDEVDSPDPTSQTTTPPTPVVNALADNITQNRIAATQSFSIDAGSWQQITGTEGTRVYVQANTFVDANGNAVTGNVDFSMIEILGKGGMIWNNVPTISNGNWLVSAGEFKFSASQNGNPLQLAPGMQPWVEVPGGQTPNNNMVLWEGSTNANGDFTWAPDSGQVNVWQDSITGWNYNFNMDSLDWINLDVYMNDPAPQTSLTVTLPNGYDDSNTMVWVVFNNDDAAAQLGSWNAGTNSFGSGSWYTIGEGSDVTIVALSEVNGNYFSSFSSTTITNSHVETISNMQATSLSAFETQINGL